MLLQKLMGLMVIVLVNGDLCPIIIQPTEVVVKYGASASANCSNSTAHQGMGWRTTQGQKTMTNDAQLVTWNVESLKDWDVRLFCYINVSAKDQCDVRLPVTVYKIPDKVSISTVAHSGPMYEGNQYQLQCNIQNVAPVKVVTVSWYNKATLVKNTTITDPTESPLNLSLTLQISPSRDDNGAQYWCEVKLDLGPEGPHPPPAVMSDPLNITVYYGPVSACSNWSPVINTTLGSYPFPFLGNPPPRVSWFYRGLRVNPSKHLSKNDIGKYKYTAINSVNSALCFLNITVEYEPEMAPGDDSVEINRGLNVSLTCKAEGNPKPDLRWSFNNKAMASGKGEATLIIAKVKLTDAGEYTCTAANKHGTQKRKVSLEVKDLCPITLEPATVLVEYGFSVSANCSTFITHNGMGWEASQGYVDMTNDVQLISWSVESLEKWDIRPFCYINLTADDQCRVPLPVTVYKIPDNVSISTGVHTGPMVEGKQYDLRCDIQNVAPVKILTVNWYKEDMLVGNTTYNDSRKTPVNQLATFQISPKRGDDGAQYRCEAEMDLGAEEFPVISESDSVRITVHYMPEINCSNWSPVKYTTLSSFPFSVVGNPTPQFSWIRRGSSSNESVESTKLLTKDDSGQYYCIATNQIGSVSCVTNITVKYGPEFVSGEDSVEVDRGKETSLSCKAEGDPVPDVWWTFNNENKTTGRGQTTLTIAEAKLSDGGEYICTATNIFGTQTRRVLLVVNDICPITLHPAKVVIEHGASASANCSTAITHKGMGWEASEGQVDMRDDVQFIIWSVKSLEEWDIAPYCYISQENEPCRKHLEVTVYKIPDSVSISTVGYPRQMAEGQQYELQCDIQNVAPVNMVTVKWYKGDTPVETKTFNNSDKNPKNLLTKLQITPKRGDDGAQYRCEAVLDLGSEVPRPPPALKSDPLNMTVLYKPFSACPDWSPVNNTNLGAYPFPFVGNPPPRVSWSYRGIKVEPTKHLGKDDSGQYLYNASNSEGNISCVISITVHYGPTFKCLAVYEGREHSLFSYKCTPLASPVANVFWYKDGVKVQPPYNLTRRDTGLYIIKAQNEYGTVLHNLSLNVLYAPVIAALEDSVVVYKGNAVSLLCKAEGNPEPDVSWNFKDQNKLTGKRQATLNISGVTAADGGVYTCSATNKLGTQKRTVSVAVNDYTVRIVSIILIVLVIVIILICVAVYLRMKKRGNYNVHGGEGVGLSLLGNGKVN